MPCGQYCYQRKWQCQGGRLRQLTNVQKQPGPTRNYGSENARENSIRRRVMSVKNNGSKTNYGPLFGGKKKPAVFSNCGFCGDRSVAEGKNVYYNNGGTSGTNTYWNKIAAGPKGVKGMTCCCQDEQIVTISTSDSSWNVDVYPPGTPWKPQVGWTIMAWPTEEPNSISVGVITRIIEDTTLAAGDAPVTYATGWATYGVRPFSRACGAAELPGWDGQSLVPFSNFTAGTIGALEALCCHTTSSGGAASAGAALLSGVDPPNGIVTATPPQGPCDKNRLCGGDNGTTLLGGAPCSLGGKNWLNYRRFHPRGAKS